MSKILAKVMLQQQLLGKRILEIGCGIALASIVIKRQGGNITASDYHPLAAAFLLENTHLNALEPILFADGNWNDISSDLGQFDLIIGSDILYEPHHIQLVSAFISHHSSADVEVVVVDPGRGAHRAFARTMEQLGYHHTWSNLKDYPNQGVQMKGFILRFTRKD